MITTALDNDMTYTKVIAARFVTRRDGNPMHCITCNAILVMGNAAAAVTADDAWHSYCGDCAATPAAQIRGLYARVIEVLDAPVPIEVQDLVRAFVTAESAATFRAAKQALMTVRAEAGKAAAAEREANGLDLSSIPSGTYAVPGGDTRLKVKIDNVDKGKWAGFIFVKDGAEYGEGKRYGMQKPGGTYKGQIEDALRAIVADLAGAAKAYADITGTCSFCHLTLENKRSTDVGYGPVCAEKYGLPW